MTVHELIDLLRCMPQDAKVMHPSVWCDGELMEITRIESQDAIPSLGVEKSVNLYD